MKYLLFNRKSLLFSALLATSFGLNAQIQSTHTDTKFAYTTVVYKDKAATDKDVLSALDNSIGMGDVVRVTVAPPKPAAVPTVDKTQGEDVWLKPTAPANTLTAATSAKMMAPASPLINHIAAAPKASPAVAKPAPVAAKPVVNNVTPTEKPVAKTVAPAPKPVEVQEQTQMAISNIAASPRTVTSKSSVTSKASKSANKSLKKGGKKGSSFKMKSRKKGKQRYSCPKF